MRLSLLVLLYAAACSATAPSIVTDQDNLLLIVDENKNVGYRRGNFAPAVLFEDLATKESLADSTAAADGKYQTKKDAAAYADQMTRDQQRQDGATKGIEARVDSAEVKLDKQGKTLTAMQTDLTAVEKKAGNVATLAAQIGKLNTLVATNTAKHLKTDQVIQQQAVLQEKSLKAALAKITTLEQQLAKGVIVGVQGTCNSGAIGLLRLDTESTLLEICINYGGKYRFVATSPEKKYRSCKELLRSNPLATTGKHTILNANGADMTVWCDMDADGGGWTLMAYAGRIYSNKRNTLARVGKAACTNCYQMLFDQFGDYNADAPNNHIPFSQMRHPGLKNLVKDNSQILAMRTSDRNKQMIWQATSVARYRRGSSLPDVKKLRLTLNGKNYGDYSPINVFQRGCTLPCYTGWDLNMCGNNLGCGSSNCDNCYGWAQKRISHRALLYWETGDSSYAATQWFHADPLTLDRSGDPRNTKQDIGFYVREA